MSAFIFISTLGFSKTQVSENDYRGYYEVIYIDETPLPKITAESQERGFILFIRSTLDRIYKGTIPKSDEIKDSVSIFVAKGEYEPVQIGIYPLKDLKGVRISAGDLVDNKGNRIDKSNIDIKIIRYLAQRVGLDYMRYFGVLPKTIEKMEEIDISKGVTRGVWITIKAPLDAIPGKYQTEIKVSPENGKHAILKLEVEVLPFSIVSAPNNMYAAIYTSEFSRLSDTKDKKSIDKIWELAEKIFIDMKEHGMTTVSPESQLNYEEKDGHPAILDLEATLKLHKKVGFPHPVLYYNGPMLRSAKTKNAGNIRDYKANLHPDMARKIAKYYDEYCKKEGYPGVIYITVDEPGFGDGVGNFPPDTRQKIGYELYKAVKSVGGRTALTCTPDSIKPLADVVDWWILAWITPDVVSEAKSKKAKIGIYPNSAVMGQGTIYSRFVFGFYAWANNLEAVTPWTYPLSPSYSPDDFMKKGEGKYKVIDGFLGIDGKPITTIQWELVREGIDDAKYLYTLESAIKEAKSLSPSNPAIKSAEMLLDSIRKNVEMDIKKYKFEHYATGELLEQPLWKPSKFDQIRREIADLIRKIKGM